jgi:hypothetical protein
VFERQRFAKPSALPAFSMHRGSIKLVTWANYFSYSQRKFALVSETKPSGISVFRFSAPKPSGIPVSECVSSVINNQGRLRVLCDAWRRQDGRYFS